MRYGLGIFDSIEGTLGIKASEAFAVSFGDN